MDSWLNLSCRDTPQSVAFTRYVTCMLIVLAIQTANDATSSSSIEQNRMRYVRCTGHYLRISYIVGISILAISNRTSLAKISIQIDAKTTHMQRYIVE